MRDAQIGLRREHVGLPHHERRAQIVKHLDKHQRSASHKAGQAQRKNHPPKQAPAFAAQVHGGLFHGTVNVAQGHREVHQNEGEVVDRLDKDDAVQALHDGQREAKPVVEQKVERARAAKDQLQRHRAHKGRHDQRQDAQSLDEDGPAKIKAHGEVSQRHRNQGRKDGRHDRHVQAVEKRLAHQVLREKGPEMPQGQAVVTVQKSGDKDPCHRQHKKQQQEDQHQPPCEPDAGAHIGPNARRLQRPLRLQGRMSIIRHGVGPLRRLL